MSLGCPEAFASPLPRSVPAALRLPSALIWTPGPCTASLAPGPPPSPQSASCTLPLPGARAAKLCGALLKPDPGTPSGLAYGPLRGSRQGPVIPERPLPSCCGDVSARPASSSRVASGSFSELRRGCCNRCHCQGFSRRRRRSSPLCGWGSQAQGGRFAPGRASSVLLLGGGALSSG